MKLHGTCLLPGTPVQVWELLNDPARLAKCLPGCETLEPIGPDRYKVAVKFAIAAVGGNFAGSVALGEKKPPKSLRIEVESKGAAGFMKGQGTLELAAKSAQTELRYTGEVHVGGLIASIGQRMLEGASRRILQQFFESAAEQLRESIGRR